LYEKASEISIFFDEVKIRNLSFIISLLNRGARDTLVNRIAQIAIMNASDMDIEQVLLLLDQFASVESKRDKDCTPAELKLKKKLKDAKSIRNQQTQSRVVAEAKDLSAESSDLKSKQNQLKKNKDVQTLLALKQEHKVQSSKINAFIKGSDAATALVELEKKQKKNNTAISALNKKGKESGIEEAIVPIKRGGGRKSTKKDAEGDVVMNDGEGDSESDHEEDSSDQVDDEE